MNVGIPNCDDPLPLGTSQRVRTFYRQNVRSDQFVNSISEVRKKLKRFGRVRFRQIPFDRDAGIKDVFHSSSRDCRTKSTATLTTPSRRRTSSVAWRERS